MNAIGNWGTAIAAGAQIAGGVAGQNAAKYNAGMQQQITNDQIAATKIKQRKDVGAQISTRAGSGVVIDDGSPILALEDTLRIHEMDLDALRRTGQLRVHQEQQRGQAAFMSGLTGAANTFLTKSYYDTMKANALKINNPSTNYDPMPHATKTWKGLVNG